MSTTFSVSVYTFVRPFIKFIQENLENKFVNNDKINCSCQCPQGKHLEYVYGKNDSLDGCIQSCIQLIYNLCTISNTYACLGIDCKYSKLYNVSTNITTHDQHSPIRMYKYL